MIMEKYEITLEFAGEAFYITPKISIKVGKSQWGVALVIKAPRNVSVHREEIYEQIHNTRGIKNDNI